MIYVEIGERRGRRLPFYLAAEEYVARELPDGEYFMVWSVDPTVICGRNQLIDIEVNLEYCRANGIDVCRRRSGGGCVYADRDNLMFSYITPSQHVTTTFGHYTSLIADMLQGLGLDAHATGRNDIVIGDRKVSGNAFYHIPGRSIVHGTMLFATNLTNMLRAITPSRSKLKSKQVQSVESRITTISQHQLQMSIDDFKQYAISRLTDSRLTLNDEDISKIEAIEQRYYDPKWLRLSQHTTDSKISRYVEGVGQIAIDITVDNGVIADIDFSGDFFALGDVKNEILSKLQGKRLNRPELEAALSDFDCSGVISGLSTAQLIDLLTDWITYTMDNQLKHTCLHDKHIALGALMSPFGGFDMPIQYSDIESEHRAVRNACGVFDVSHMGEVEITGPDAERYVNHIFTNDISTIDTGKIVYGMMLYDNGGTVDDLLVYKRGDNDFLLVINASNIDKDVEWIVSHSDGYDITIDHSSDRWGEIAVQGPEAASILSRVLDIDADDLAFYTFKIIGDIIVSRTGYTGEDGFEIYASPATIRDYWDRLIAAGVAPCGLGCRDTLRFEAGLPLYGDELSAEITPLEAGLGTFVKLDKPDFIGRQALAAQKAEGVKRKIVGLEVEGHAIPRHGYDVLDTEGNKIGEITTGYHSITLDRNIAMALIDASFAAIDTPLQVQVRRKIFPAKVVKKRFYTPKYKK